jgi:hypothetical protein
MKPILIINFIIIVICNFIVGILQHDLFKVGVYNSVLKISNKRIKILLEENKENLLIKKKIETLKKWYNLFLFITVFEILLFLI